MKFYKEGFFFSSLKFFCLCFSFYDFPYSQLSQCRHFAMTFHYSPAKATEVSLKSKLSPCLRTMNSGSTGALVRHAYRHLMDVWALMFAVFLLLPGSLRTLC